MQFFLVSPKSIRAEVEVGVGIGGGGGGGDGGGQGLLELGREAAERLAVHEDGRVRVHLSLWTRRDDGPADLKGDISKCHFGVYFA